MGSKRKRIVNEEASTSKVQTLEGANDPQIESKLKKKSKKSKHNKEVTSDSYVDTSSIEEDTHTDKENSETHLKDIPAQPDHASFPDWPTAHMNELLRRMESKIPAKDNLVFRSRVDRLNWEEIAFESYTAGECRVMWEAIQKRVRRFRLLHELIEDAKVWVSKPWTNYYRSNKTNRHPDMPRRPLTTYMIFYMKKKDKVLKENPGIDVTSLSKHIAEMYKKLSPTNKEKYTQKAAKQRLEYEEKLKEFYRVHPELVPSRTGAEKIINHNAPKKPVTPFKLFLEDSMKNHLNDPDFNKVTFIEQCKETWKNLSEKKKNIWINWALEREAKYQEDMKNYMAENPNLTMPAQPIKGILTKEERTINERQAGKPKKPPNSAYSLFSRMMLNSEHMKSISPKERMSIISQQWRNLPDSDKKQYNDKLQHMLEQYKLQYAEYLESLPEDKRQLELESNIPKKGKGFTKKGARTLKIMQEASTSKTMSDSPVKKNKRVCITTSPSGKQYFEGEPKEPPVTPFLLFAQNFIEGKHGNVMDAQKLWDSMNDDQKDDYKRLLLNRKKEFIEKYEVFLKTLTPKQLKEYSAWKKKVDTQESSCSDSANEKDCSGSD